MSVEMLNYSKAVGLKIRVCLARLCAILIATMRDACQLLASLASSGNFSVRAPPLCGSGIDVDVNVT